jgi:hypothetical protein
MENDNSEAIAIKKLQDEKIYRRLTINMQNKMAKFRDGRSKKDSLNTQLIINISSLCKFLRKNELEKIKEEEERVIRKNKKEELENELDKIKKKMLEQEKIDKKKKEKERAKNKNKNELNTKKLSEEMQKLRKEKQDIEDIIKKLEKEEKESSNTTILDVFVPHSRLSKFIQNKLESLNEEIQEEEDEGDNNLSLEGDQLDLNNSLEHDKISDLIADEDADDDLNANANTEFLTNDNLSISQSFYHKPIGFDEFKNNDNELKFQKDSISDKELIKNVKTNEIVMPEINKEDELKRANEDFKKFLKPKEIKEIVYDMSYDYIKYMKTLYDKMKAKSEEDINESNSQTKTLNFINQFKSFILDIGISDKKFYEQCIREIIYNKSELEFGEFLNCFKKLLNLKFDQIFLKYKFLLNIVEREDDEYFNKEELEKYYYLIYNCKKVNENEIQEEIRSKLLSKYMKIFPKNDKIYTRKLSLVLEQFFDIK